MLVDGARTRPMMGDVDTPAAALPGQPRLAL
jgi:hypothetical protein